MQGRFIFVDDAEPEPVSTSIFEPPPEPPPGARLSGGLVASGIVHIVIMIALIRRQYVAPATPPVAAEEPPRVIQRIRLPPRAELQKLLPPAARPPAPAPTPPPPPPPAAPVERPKDRISVGAAAPPRKGPMVLRREDDITKTPKGRPDALPTAAPPATLAAASEPSQPEAGGSMLPVGVPLPPGAGPLPAGRAGDAARTPLRGPSIASSLQNLERRIQTTGPIGVASGTGQQMGPLFFDPEGADFTSWINHFKNEVYRNWIFPQPALLGLKGKVELDFTVQRDGRVTAVHLLRGSGTPAFDRASQNALAASHFMPLPAEFAPQSVTMQVTFFYNEVPADAP